MGAHLSIHPVVRSSVRPSVARPLARSRQVDLEKSDGMDAGKKEGRKEKKEAVKRWHFLAKSRVGVGESRAVNCTLIRRALPRCLLL